MGCNVQLAGTQNRTGKCIREHPEGLGGRGERTRISMQNYKSQTDTQTSDRLMLLAQPAKAKDHAAGKVILGMVELCAKILQITCTRFEDYA